MQPLGVPEDRVLGVTGVLGLLTLVASKFCKTQPMALQTVELEGAIVRQIMPLLLADRGLLLSAIPALNEAQAAPSLLLAVTHTTPLTHRGLLQHESLCTN